MPDVSARTLWPVLLCTLVGSTALAQTPPTKLPEPAPVAVSSVVSKGLGPDAVVAAPSDLKSNVMDVFKGDVDTSVLTPEVIGAVQAKDWQKVKEAFDGKSMQVATTRFVWGLALANLDDHQRAYDTLSALAKDDAFVLGDYASYYAQVAAFELKRWDASLQMAKRVPSSHWLYEASRLYAARALLAQGTPATRSRAVKIYEAFLKRYARSGSAPDVALKLGELYEQKKAWGSALKAYEHVLEHRPLNREARTATARIKRLLPKLPKAQRRAYEARAPERKRSQIEAMFARHKSDQITAMGARLAPRLKKGQAATKTHCEMLYMVAKSYSKLRTHEQSAPWYDRLIEECQAYPSAYRRALYLGGKAYWNAGMLERAKSTYQKLWERFPSHSYADDSMYFTARILREQGKDAEAAALLAKQVKAHPTGDMASDAHWLTVRAWFEAKAYDKVVGYVDGLKDPGEDDLYSRGRLAYFAGRAKELSGKQDAALATYKAVVGDHPMSYYALLAFQGIGRLNGVDLGKDVDLCALEDGALCASSKDMVVFEPSEIIAKELSKDKEVRQGVGLLRLGLDDWASRTFKRIRGRYANAQDKLWALAWMLDAAGAYPYSHDIPRRHMKDWKVAVPQVANRAKWTVAFPQPFVATVEQYATQRDMKSALIYAIMREESGFNPRVESWANARGLMQLMDATAKRIAQKDGMSDYDADKLFDPFVNIRLGSAYLKELSTQFDDHPALVIAGYNGGYGNVGRWLKERGALPFDLWVEDIPFGQTRNYTKRVLTTYWTYDWLYGKTRVPTVGFALPSP